MITEYLLPAYWASALVNNDYDSLSEYEISELLEWKLKNNPGICSHCSEESFFSKSNDVSGLGGDCLVFYFQ